MRLLAPSILVLVLALGACTSRRPDAPADAGEDASTDAPRDASLDAPEDAPLAASAAPPPSASAAPPPLTCPKAMIAIDGRYCVDKWEASLIDKVSRAVISPYYPPERRLATQIADTWETERLSTGDDKARSTPIPALPAWQRERDPDPVAVSRPGTRPNGYLTQLVAARACANAGKRLCKPAEWKTACEGEQRRAYPYGDTYVAGACNIFRSTHPAVVLHDNAAQGHLDPRLNLVREKNGDPLLRATGATSRCKSEWGDDAAWDMNGNLDEWVDDEPLVSAEPVASGAPMASASSAPMASASSAPAASASASAKPRPIGLQTGIFLGGFYSRSKTDGCASRITKHLKSYFDYSTGVRCCWSPEPGNTGMLPPATPAD